MFKDSNYLSIYFNKDPLVFPLIYEIMRVFLEQTLKKEEDTKLTKAELKRREAELVRREQAKHMGIDLDAARKEKKEFEKEKKEIVKDIEERKANGEEVDYDDELDEALRGIQPNINHILREERLLEAEKYHKVIEASGLDDVLSAIDDKGVKHPEKKVKAVITLKNI